MPIGSRNYESGTHGNIDPDSRNQTDNAFDGDRRRRAGGSHAPRNPPGENFQGANNALDFHKADENSAIMEINDMGDSNCFEDFD